MSREIEHRQIQTTKHPLPDGSRVTHSNGVGRLVESQSRPRVQMLFASSEYVRPNTRLLDEFVMEPQVIPLGQVVARTDIESSMGPFLRFPDYKTQYPDIVTLALGNLYNEYNDAFVPLVKANREWDTDYQYCITPEGKPINYFVQIDMVGLPEKFLSVATNTDEKEVRDGLKGGIFEIENSVAMYQLLGELFSQDGKASGFKQGFRESLDHLRKKYNKPIALLAVTDEKYQAMKESEFGKLGDKPLTDDDVRELSGFDKFFGPREFVEHVRRNSGNSDYLLYARTSEPVAKLKKPGIKVENPLLEVDELRRIIKANTLTLNVDNPAWEPGSPRRINDTKAYLQPMKMAYTAETPEDIFTVVNGNGRDPQVSMNGQLTEYLISQGIDPLKIAAQDVKLRAKPLKGTYGCYGHASGNTRDKSFRADVRRGMRDRGHYVVQPEMTTPTVINETDGAKYPFIDRNFLSFTDGPRFLGGFRSLMPEDSTEASKGRIHGNSSTVWAEVK